MRRLALLAIFLLVFSTSSESGGLIGDAFRAVGAGKIGDQLDDASRQFKEHNPAYKNLEEGGSNAVRHIFSEAEVESLWPAVVAAIQGSRQAAINDGVFPIPENVKQSLQGFFDDGILNSTYFRIGGGGDLSLQVNAFRYGDRVGITLINVIVFVDQQTANDLSIWAHELQHARQYRAWGVVDFAKPVYQKH